jgi:hypothetical protein
MPKFTAYTSSAQCQNHDYCFGLISLKIITLLHFELLVVDRGWQRILFYKHYYILFLGLSHSVYKGVMRKGYKIPTPIQRKVNYMYCVLNRDVHVNIINLWCYSRNNVCEFVV